MRRASVTCDECGAMWDARTAGFCGRCGALLDSPAAPTVISREPTPSGDRSSGAAPNRGTRLTVVAGLMGLVAVLVAGTVFTDGDTLDEVGVDLPDTEAVDDVPRSDGLAAQAVLSERPTCRLPDEDDDFDCIAWERAWSVESPNDTGAFVPTIATNHGVLVFEHGDMRLIDSASGDISWETSVDPMGSDLWPWTMDGDHVVVSGFGAGFFVIDLAQQTVHEWGTELTGTLWLQPLGADSVAHVQGDPGSSNDQTLVVHSIEDGSERWRRTFSDLSRDEDLDARPVQDGVLVTTCCRPDGRTAGWLLDPDTGEVEWHLPDLPNVWDVTDGLLLAVQGPVEPVEGGETPSSTSLSMLDVSTGTTVWSSDDLDLPPFHDVTPHGRLLLISPVGERGITALDRRDGSVVWQQPDVDGWVSQGTPWPLFMPGSDALIVHGHDGSLHRLDPETGEIVWAIDRRPRDAVNAHALGIFEDQLFLQEAGGLTVVDLATGTPLITVQAPDAHPVSVDPLILNAPGRLFRVDTAALETAPD